MAYETAVIKRKKTMKHKKMKIGGIGFALVLGAALAMTVPAKAAPTKAACAAAKCASQLQVCATQKVQSCVNKDVPGNGCQKAAEAKCRTDSAAYKSCVTAKCAGLN